MIISGQAMTKNWRLLCEFMEDTLPAKNQVIILTGEARLSSLVESNIFLNYFTGAIIATCPDESSLADSSGVIMDFNMQTQSTLKALEKSLMIISDSRSDRSDYSVRKTEC